MVLFIFNIFTVLVDSLVTANYIGPVVSEMLEH